jgi:hypothetical protein
MIYRGTSRWVAAWGHRERWTRHRCFCLWDGLWDEDIESRETRDTLKGAAGPRLGGAAAPVGVVAVRGGGRDRERWARGRFCGGGFTPGGGSGGAPRRR